MKTIILFLSISRYMLGSFNLQCKPYELIYLSCRGKNMPPPLLINNICKWLSKRSATRRIMKQNTNTTRLQETKQDCTKFSRPCCGLFFFHACIHRFDWGLLFKVTKRLILVVTVSILLPAISLTIAHMQRQILQFEYITYNNFIIL